MNPPLNNRPLFHTGVCYLPGSRFPRGIYHSPIHAQAPVFTTGKPSKPFRQHVLRGIDVAVMGGAAYRARPFPNIQPQLTQDMSATSTGLGAWIPPIRYHQSTAVPLGLVLNLTAELSEGGIGEVPSQLRVLNHVPHREVIPTLRRRLRKQMARALGAGYLIPMNKN